MHYYFVQDWAVPCTCLFFAVCLGHGGRLRVRGSPADLPSAPRTCPCWLNLSFNHVAHTPPHRVGKKKRDHSYEFSSPVPQGQDCQGNFELSTARPFTEMAQQVERPPFLLLGHFLRGGSVRTQVQDVVKQIECKQANARRNTAPCQDPLWCMV